MFTGYATAKNACKIFVLSTIFLLSVWNLDPPPTSYISVPPNISLKTLAKVEVHPIISLKTLATVKIFQRLNLPN